MKKTTLLIFIIICSSLLQAQNTNPIPCPTDKNNNKWGVGVQVNTIDNLPPLGNGAILDERCLLGAVQKDKSFSFGLLGNYMLKENCALNLKIGYTQRNIIEDKLPDLPDSNYIINHVEIKQEKFKITPGIQWYIKQNKFIFYGGFDMPFSLFNEMTISSHADSYTNNTLSYIEDDMITVPGGISVGIGSIIGFNIKITNHISIGSDASFAFLYSKIGNGETITTITSSIPGNPSQTTTTKIKDSIQKLGISGLQGAFNISYWFK
ncbi:MAG: outer membrane beta-barrel protein [Bacteroidales bacterium]|jgi:hypothetical protein